jgi:hypothetical protein
LENRDGRLPLRKAAFSRARTKSLFWSEHHQHLAAFHPGMLFHLGCFGRIGLNALEEPHSKLAMRKLAATEAQGDLHLVAFADEVETFFIFVS